MMINVTDKPQDTARFLFALEYTVVKNIFRETKTFGRFSGLLKSLTPQKNEGR
jgi:hypothetical protein